MTVRLVALHGFLGRASDWDRLAGLMPDASLQALDLWQILGDAGVDDWESATAALDRALAEAAVPKTGSGPLVVVGYSFGARLALGSRLLASPGSPVQGCCFVSCHPGLPDADTAARDARRASDDAWARRLLEEPEDALWRAWDAQPVFAGSVRRDSHRPLPAPRQALSRALAACSLAGQPDLRPRLRAWPTPALWVTGDRDSRFTAIAGELRDAGAPIGFARCGHAGHRVPWDDPPAFAAVLRRWTTDVAAGFTPAGRDDGRTIDE